MLEKVELYVYDNYIKEMVVEENGIKKIAKERIDALNLPIQERNFIMYIINKQNIKVTEEKITRADRSPYVRDNNYGDVKANDLQKIDEPVMSEIEYSPANEKVFENYEKLDEYLEKRFIPNYVLLKQKKNSNGEMEYFSSIRLHHIMALKLSEAEVEHVMDYLKKQNIRVGGKGVTFEEFDNFDYVNTYKESELPLSVPSNETLRKINEYKQTGNEKLRNEIIKENMRLVPFVTYRYAISTGIDQHELDSYGYQGLILAVENFDANRGCAFSTYAVSYIRGYTLDGIQEIMGGKRDNFYYDYMNAKNAVEKEYGITLSEEPAFIDDVIDLLVATGKIKGDSGSREYAKARIISMTIGNASLDDKEMVEELTTNGQLVDTHDYTEDILNLMSVQTLNEVLHTLSAREEQVIRLRFGLDDGRQRTLEEVGRVFNVPRERVRQIEAKALRKLRHYSRAKYLKDVNFDTENYSK